MFISVCALTEAAEEKVRDTFYDELEVRMYEKIPKHNAIITLGDLHAKLGHEESFGDAFGEHSLLQETSNNGLRIVQFAASKSFRVISILFPRSIQRNMANTWNERNKSS